MRMILELGGILAAATLALFVAQFVNQNLSDSGSLIDRIVVADRAP